MACCPTASTHPCQKWRGDVRHQVLEPQENPMRYILAPEHTSPPPSHAPVPVVAR